MSVTASRNRTKGRRQSIFCRYGLGLEAHFMETAYDLSGVPRFVSWIRGINPRICSNALFFFFFCSCIPLHVKSPFLTQGTSKLNIQRKKNCLSGIETRMNVKRTGMGLGLHLWLLEKAWYFDRSHWSTRALDLSGSIFPSSLWLLPCLGKTSRLWTS